MMKRRLLSALLALATMLSSANVIAFAEKGGETTDSSVSTPADPVDGESEGDPEPEPEPTEDVTVEGGETDVQTVDENGDESTPTPTPEAPVAEATPEPEVTETPAPVEDVEEDNSTPSPSETPVSEEKPSKPEEETPAEEENKPVDEENGVDADVMTGITLTAESNLVARKIAKDEKFLVATLENVPLGLTATNCELKVEPSDFVAEALSTDGKTEVQIFAKDDKDLLPGKYKLSVDLTIKEDDAASGIKQGAHRLVEETVTVNGRTISGIEASDSSKIGVAGGGFAASVTLPDPTSATPEAKDMPTITGFKVKVGNAELEYGDDKDYTLKSELVDIVRDAGEAKTATLTAKAGSLGKEEIVTITGKFIEDYKILVKVPAYNTMEASKPKLEVTSNTSPVSHFTKGEATNPYIFEVKDGKDIYDKYTKLEEGTISFSIGADAAKDYPLTGENVTYPDGLTVSGKTITLTADFMKKITSDITVSVKVSSTVASETDIISLSSTLTMLEGIEKEPVLEEDKATILYVPTSTVPQTLHITNPVKGMAVTVKNTTGNADLVEGTDFVYNSTDNTITIKGEYLDKIIEKDSDEQTLTVSFAYKDAPVTSTVKFATTGNIPALTDNGTITYSNLLESFNDFSIEVEDATNVSAIESVEAEFAGKDKTLELTRNDWTYNTQSRDLIINAAWLNAIKADTSIGLANTNKIKFSAKVTMLNGAKVTATMVNGAAVAGLPDAGALEFTFNEGNGVMRYKGSQDKWVYYTVLEIVGDGNEDPTKEQAYMRPFDLEAAFDGANGTKLYAVPGLTVDGESAKSNVTVKNTILTPVAATGDSEAEITLKTDIAKANYKPITIKVYVVDKFNGKVDAQIEAPDTEPGTTVDTTTTPVTVNLGKTGSLASGSFDLATLFKGTQLPPYQDEKSVDNFSVSVKYKNQPDKENPDENDLKDVNADKALVGLSGTTVTALKTDGTGVEFIVSFTDSTNGYEYNPVTVKVVPTVADQTSDSINTELYTGKQDSTDKEPKDDEKLMATFNAAGVSFSGNTITYNLQKFMLAKSEEKVLDLIIDKDVGYSIPVWITTSAAAEGVKVEYEVVESIEKAQALKSPTGTPAYKNGFKHNIPIADKDGKPLDGKTLYIVWKVTTGDGTDKKEVTSISELKISVKADEATRTEIGTNAWELVTPSGAKATYAESGITVTGKNIVYSPNAKTSKEPLTSLTLQVKAPAGASAYAVSTTPYGEYKAGNWDLKDGLLTATVTLADAANAQSEKNLKTLDDKYIRWTIKTGEGADAVTSTQYTHVRMDYNYTALDPADYADIAFSVKNSSVALGDGSKALAKDALYAGDVATNIALAATVAYQDAAGKPAIAEKELDAKTEVTWDFKFVNSDKKATDFSDLTGDAKDKHIGGVYVKFANNKTSLSDKQAMDITVSKGVTKGGTLTITGTFHNDKIIGDVTETLTLKIAPLHYVESAVPSATKAQLLLTTGRTVAYAPKVTLYPSNKAVGEAKWTAVNAEGKAEGVTIEEKTGKATFSAPGVYTLSANYYATRLGQKDAQRLLDKDISITVTVVDKKDAYKSLALADSKAKTVDLRLTADKKGPKLEAYVPLLKGKDASGAEINIDPTAEPYNDMITYQVTYGKNAATTIVPDKGVITADVGKGGATAKVTAFYMGKSVTFTVNAYATDEVDKAVLTLYKDGKAVDNKSNPVTAGVIYDYKLMTTGRSAQEITYLVDALEIAGDGKNLTAYSEYKVGEYIYNNGGTYKLDTKNKTIQFLAPVSGKINYTLNGDPKSRKGSLAVNTSKTAVAPTSIFFDGTEKHIKCGAGAELSGNTFSRLGTDDATITITPTLTPSWAYDQFTWTVSDSKIATIKANKDGSATLTWKKETEKNTPIYVTATTKSKDAKTSYTMPMYLLDEVPSILGNPKSIFINVADNSVGTMIAISEDYYGTVKVVSYDKKNTKYVAADGYSAEIKDNIVTLRASSTAKSGKFYLELDGSVYLPITTKLAKVTDQSKIAVTGKVGAVNNAVYGSKAPITLTGKNVDPLSVLLEMPSEVKDLVLVKEDGQWYLKYTGTPVADKTKTPAQTVAITYSIPGVTLSNNTINLKVSYKAAVADYNFTVKPLKIATLGGANMFDDGIKLELVNKSGVIDDSTITKAEFVTGKAKGSFIDDYFRVEKVSDELRLFVRRDAENNQVTIPAGKLVGDLKLTFEGGAVAQAAVTMTVNTDATAKTVKVSKATITGSMPIIDASLTGNALKAELQARGAYLTFTKPADLADVKITDARVSSPANFEVVQVGNSESFRIGYTGALSQYQTLKEKLVIEVAYGDKLVPEEGEYKATAVATIQIAKPAAAFTKEVPFTVVFNGVDLPRNDAGHYLLDMQLGGEKKTIGIFIEGSGFTSSGFTVTSNKPEVVKSNSFNNTLYAQSAGTATITVSKVGCEDQYIDVTVAPETFDLKSGVTGLTGSAATGYTYTTAFKTEQGAKNELLLTAILADTDGVSVDVPAKDQKIIKYVADTNSNDNVDDSKFEFAEATADGVTVTLRKANADPISLKIIVTPADMTGKAAFTETLVSGDVATGFTIDGLTVGTDKEKTAINLAPTGSTVMKDPVISDESAIKVIKGTANDMGVGVYAFERIKDTGNDVTVTFSAVGHKDVVVTIKSAKRPTADLLKALPYNENLWVEEDGSKATLTLGKGTSVEIAEFETTGTAKTITVVGTTETATVVTTKVEGKKVTFTAGSKADSVDLTLKAEGYEDAKLTVVVLETAPTYDPITVKKGDKETGSTPTLTDGYYVIDELAIDPEAAQETKITFADKGGNILKAKTDPSLKGLTLSPAPAEATYSYSLKASEYIKDGVLVFTFEGNYKPVKVKVSTVDQPATELVKQLKADPTKGFTVADGKATLALEMGKTVDIVFGDKINVTLDSTNIGDVATVTASGATYTFEPKEVALDSNVKTLQLKADGYADLGLTVSVKAGTPVVTKDDGSAPSVKDNKYELKLTPAVTDVTLVFKNADGKAIPYSTTYNNAKVTVDASQSAQGKIKFTYKDPADSEEIEFTATGYENVKVAVTAEAATGKLSDFFKETTDAVGLTKSGDDWTLKLFADEFDYEIALTDESTEAKPVPTVTLKTNGVNGGEMTEVNGSLTKGKATFTGKKASSSGITLTASALGYANDVTIKVVIEEGADMKLEAPTPANGADYDLTKDSETISVPTAEDEIYKLLVKNNTNADLAVDDYKVTVSTDGSESVKSVEQKVGFVEIKTNDNTTRSNTSKLHITAKGHKPVDVTVKVLQEMTVTKGSDPVTTFPVEIADLPSEVTYNFKDSNSDTLAVTPTKTAGAAGVIKLDTTAEGTIKFSLEDGQSLPTTDETAIKYTVKAKGYEPVVFTFKGTAAP